MGSSGVAANKKMPDGDGRMCGTDVCGCVIRAHDLTLLARLLKVCLHEEVDRLDYAWVRDGKIEYVNYIYVCTYDTSCFIFYSAYSRYYTTILPKCNTHLPGTFLVPSYRLSRTMV